MTPRYSAHRLEPDLARELEALAESGHEIMHVVDASMRANRRMRLVARGLVCATNDAAGLMTMTVSSAGYAFLAERERWRERVESERDKQERLARETRGPNAYVHAHACLCLEGVLQ